MLKKYKLIFLVFLSLILGVGMFFLVKKVLTPEKVHFHAGFAVFQDDKKINFSEFKYMYVKPCSIDGNDKETEEGIQLEKAHLHDNVGDVVHAESKGGKWKDVFTNIRYTIDYSKSVGYINGNKVEDFDSQNIKPTDTLLVFIGNNDINKDLRLAPTKDYVEKMAKKSKTCGD